MTTSVIRRALLVGALALGGLPGCSEFDSGPEVEMNRWQRVGPLSVIVRSVTARQVTGNTYLGAGYSKEPVCVVTIGVKVDEEGKEFQYLSPSSASLRDADGRSYRKVSFEMGAQLNETARSNKVMRAKDTTADIVTFEKDAAKAKTLHLHLSMQWMEKVDGQWKRKSGGTARFKLEK